MANGSSSDFKRQIETLHMWPISSWCTYKKNAPNKRKECLKAPSTPNSKQIFSQINKVNFQRNLFV